ncbi:hypothetical protein ACFWAN_54040, partial [Streptomyces mirabilis]
IFTRRTVLLDTDNRASLSCSCQCATPPEISNSRPADRLTIAQGQDDAVLEEAEADLRGRLPVTARVSSVDLLVHDGLRWQRRASFALG